MCEQAETREVLVDEVSEWAGTVLDAASKLSLLRDWLGSYAENRTDKPYWHISVGAIEGAHTVILEVEKALAEAGLAMCDVKP